MRDGTQHYCGDVSGPGLDRQMPGQTDLLWQHSRKEKETLGLSWILSGLKRGGGSHRELCPSLRTPDQLIQNKPMSPNANSRVQGLGLGSQSGSGPRAVVTSSCSTPPHPCSVPWESHASLLLPPGTPDGCLAHISNFHPPQLIPGDPALPSIACSPGRGPLTPSPAPAPSLSPAPSHPDQQRQ